MAKLEQIEEHDGLVILRLTGSLNSEGLDRIEAAFVEVAGRPGVRVVVDLTHVELVTTPALSMFVAAASAAKRLGGHIVFTESPPPVKDILKRLRLTSILTTVTGVEQAKAAARG